MPADMDPTILIVDDEAANIVLLERILRRAGYDNVVSTTDPTQVEPYFVTFRPDLILLDLHMPELNGFALMERLSPKIGPGDYVPILVLTGDLTSKSKQRALTGGAKDFLIKPFDKAEVLARVANLLDTRALHVALRNSNEVLEEKVRERTADLWDAVHHLEQTQQELRLAQEETIHRLSLAAEFRDHETSRHIQRMSAYCALLVAQAGFGGERTEAVRLASHMHDIGKIAVPDAILLKPGKLTEEESAVMKTHAEIGHRILHGSKSEVATLGAEIAWAHHEKVDGSGYPRGLKGDEIPVEGRIAAVADVFDALTTDRVYRKAFPLFEAISLMKDGRGKHFDGDLLDLFLDSMDLVLQAKQELDE